jgi:polar amino acid transport system substrate-binding protein
MALLILTAGSDLSAQSALSWTPGEDSAFDRLPPVSVATDSTWPPMEYINRQGELVGFDVDLLREIGRRSGFRPVFTTVSWDGIFAGLMARQYDMIASSVTLLEERKRRMLFSEPYFRAAQYLVVPAGKEEIRNLEDLTGGEVGAQIGTTGSRLVEGTEGVVLRAYDDLALAVEDLATGRLDGIVADMAIVEYFVLSQPRYGGLLRVADTPYTVEDYAFAVRKDLEGLRDAINDGLRSVREDGTLARIREFWFPGLEGQETFHHME